MQALSVRQPWAWFIFHAGKDIENRDWQHRVRGLPKCIWIHAAKSMTKTEYRQAIAFAKSIGVTKLPGEGDLKRGGLVGIVDLVAHVRSHQSKWFQGPTGLVLARPYPLPFRPYAGQLGLFDIT